MPHYYGTWGSYHSGEILDGLLDLSGTGRLEFIILCQVTVKISSENLFTLDNLITPNNHVRNKKESCEAQMTHHCGGVFYLF